ncbi:hypothetical protein HNP99_001801 [Flavobacterium sp. 28A]|nr:hypothetical protein [Flavobacterium sp. 28A]
MENINTKKVVNLFLISLGLGFWAGIVIGINLYLK